MSTARLGGSLRLADDLTLSRMGYGAMQLAGPEVWGPPRDRDEAVAVLREAVKSGITHIDTSDYYGPHVVNELIREALHPYPKELHVVTKVGARRAADKSWPIALSREELTTAVHDNLKHLRLDTLDVVNLRVGGFDRPSPGSIAEPFSVLAALRQEGLIGHLGVSNVSAEQLTEAQSIAPVVCVQNNYNIASRHDSELVARCAREGIAYTPVFSARRVYAVAVRGARRGRRATRGIPAAGRACVAAAALAHDPAQPGHLFGEAPAREHRRRHSHTAA